MANMIENLGLEFLMEENMVNGFLGSIVTDGKVFNGYYDAPYIQKTCKDAEFVVRLEPGEEGGYAVSGLDTHCTGPCVWDTVAEIDITPKDAERSERRLLVSNPGDEGGIAVVNLINADVLPSFLRGESIQMQMVGFPVFIDFYNDEDELYDDMPEPDFGKKMIPMEGAIVPTQFLNNHDPDSTDCENKDDDEINLIHGVIKKMYVGRFTIGEESMETFLRIFVDTHFGELELEVSREMLDDKGNVKVGEHILAGVILSGDVAIYEYDRGKVRDEEHDLRAIRYSITKGEGERLKSILSENCVYLSNVGKWEKEGRDEVAGIFDYVSKANSWSYKSHLATLTEPLDEDFKAEAKYKPGKRCLILENENNDYESIMFLQYDDEGDVSAIEVTNESRYRFVVDEASVQKEEEPAYEFASMEDSMCSKAVLFDLIGKEEELNESMLTEESENAAQEILAGFSDEGLEYSRDYHNAYKNMFGEAFARGCGHSGEEKYVRMGRTFYSEYRHGKDKDTIATEEYRAGMIKALQYAFLIGVMHSKKTVGDIVS